MQNGLTKEKLVKAAFVSPREAITFPGDGKDKATYGKGKNSVWGVPSWT